ADSSGASGAGGAGANAGGAAGGSAQTVGTAIANAAAAASSSSGTSGVKVRGVTDTKIRIGVAVVDDTSFKALGDRFTVGDIQGYWESIKKAWHNDGLLHVNGRDK